VGGNEFSELGTPLLPFAFPRRQSPTASLLSRRILRRHRVNDVEKIAKRHESLGRRPSAVGGDLLADRSIKRRIRCGHGN
jgi:hypothetical protein